MYKRTVETDIDKVNRAILMTKDNVSLAAAKRDPRKYVWYQLTGAKATFEDAHRTHDLILSKGEKYGIKLFRGYVYLVDADDLSLQFKLTEDQASKLLRKSKPWSGKVSRYKVKEGESTLRAMKKTKKSSPSKGKSGSNKKTRDSLKGLDILKSLSGEKPESHRIDGVPCKSVTIISTPATVVRLLTKKGLPRPKRFLSTYNAECENGFLYIERDARKLVRISFFTRASWKKFISQTQESPQEESKPSAKRTSSKPKQKSNQVKHRIQVDPTTLMDNLHGDTLSTQSLPTELKDPNIYKESIYGRKISTGRSRGPREGVVVGYAMVKGKHCLVKMPINAGKTKVSLLYSPTSKSDNSLTRSAPQVSYEEFLKLRAKAKSVYDDIGNKNEKVDRSNHENMQELRPEPGQTATIKFSNGKFRKTIMDVNRKTGKIAIKGSGKKLRWIPMSTVLKIAP